MTAEPSSAAGAAGSAYRGPRFARRLRRTLSLRFPLAAARFVFDLLETFRLVRFPFFAAMRSSSGTECRTAVRAVNKPRVARGDHSSQSRSFSFLGRYSSVMKLIPRRERASSSNFTPDFTISWISCCHCFAWNQG